IGTVADCPECQICQINGCVADPPQDGLPTASGMECCFGGAKIPQQAPDITTLLNRCASRDQNDSKYFVDGCSIGIPGAPSTNIQNPVSGLFNVPGTSTAFGQNQGTITKSEALLLPCNQHDICYQMCKRDKLACDERIRA